MDISQNLKVKDVMTKGVIAMPLNTIVKDIAKILVESHVQSICVTDEFGEIAGIISEMDILKTFNKDTSKLTAEDIMTDKVATISGESYVSNAVDIMVKERIHRLFITLESKDTGLTLPKRPVGSDIVKIMAKD
ncbi:MAG: hypothetical protein BWK75_04235 [Candidatus Altiarchaeales archaeon A3]|nr:MAG: hypothetical protein BWK75_04235 [Candidatus Altiarchaeales archaeon A3]